MFHSRILIQQEYGIRSVKNGANVNQFDNSCRTALMEASIMGNIKMVNLLLKNGADVKKSGVYKSMTELMMEPYPRITVNNYHTGDTALILAVLNNHYDVAKLLFIQY